MTDPLGKEINHFIGCIECYDSELKGKQKALISLSKRVEAELENRLPFEKVITTHLENDIFYIFLNSTRLTQEIAREIRKEFQGSMQYEWYERNQFIRAKWFAQKDARDVFKDRIKLSKYKRLGVFSFEEDV